MHKDSDEMDVHRDFEEMVFFFEKFKKSVSELNHDDSELKPAEHWNLSLNLIIMFDQCLSNGFYVLPEEYKEQYKNLQIESRMCERKYMAFLDEIRRRQMKDKK